MLPLFLGPPTVLYTAINFGLKGRTPYNAHVAYAVVSFSFFVTEFLRLSINRAHSLDMRAETELIVSYLVLTIAHLMNVRGVHEHGLEVTTLFYAVVIFHELFNNFTDNTIHRLIFMTNMVTCFQYFVGFIIPYSVKAAQWGWRIMTMVQWALISGVLFYDIYYGNHYWVHFVALLALPYAVPSDSYQQMGETHLVNGPPHLLLYNVSLKDVSMMIDDVKESVQPKEQTVGSLLDMDFDGPAILEEETVPLLVETVVPEVPMPVINITETPEPLIDVPVLVQESVKETTPIKDDDMESLQED